MKEFKPNDQVEKEIIEAMETQDENQSTLFKGDPNDPAEQWRFEEFTAPTFEDYMIELKRRGLR